MNSSLNLVTRKFSQHLFQDAKNRCFLTFCHSYFLGKPDLIFFTVKMLDTTLPFKVQKRLTGHLHKALLSVILH